MNDNDGALALGIGAGFLAGLVAAAWAAWWMAARFSGAPDVPGGPPTMVRALLKDEATWPAAATGWAAGLVVVLFVLFLVVMTRMPARSVDRSAGKLPRSSGVRRYINGKGPIIGRVVTGKVGSRRPVIRMTEEDQAIVVAGPRTGKTTSLAIPASVAHHGPLLVTSNKRDILDAIAPARAGEGRVWVFDPQALAGTTHPTWFWNPLTMCGDVRGARMLASIWANASREPGARSDAYFEPEGQELLSLLLLAASVGRQPLSSVYRWVSRPDTPEPIDLLQTYAGGSLMAEGLAGFQDLPDKQRAGVYGTAAKLVRWITDPNLRRWVEPPIGGVEFDPEAFPTSTDTLVSLSREGEGSASPLVTALTAAVLQAAERQAAAMPKGRLPVPLLGVLDEAANVCRWRELPDLYSHYGSRGILLMSLFQSWPQMVEAFGKEGAEKLWSASNVRVYGGGVSDTDFLKRLSDLAGEYDATHRSRSTSRDGGSRTKSTQRRSIYDVAALGAMPPGRALVLLSAAHPVMAELIPYWNGPDKRRISSVPAVPALGQGPVAP
jgi:type IV secretory pathway TraG/TraD family ATPase VirD4